MNGMKFRVWLDKTKTMIYPESTGTPLVLIQEGYVRRFDYNIKTNEYDLLSLGEPYTIFFSTLYRDRNGKLIYEGDIVKDVIGEDYYLIQFGLIDGFYGVRLPKFDKVQGIHYLAQRVIVAGNIKENYKEFTSRSKPQFPKNGGKTMKYIIFKNSDLASPFRYRDLEKFFENDPDLKEMLIQWGNLPREYNPDDIIPSELCIFEDGEIYLWDSITGCMVDTPPLGYGSFEEFAEIYESLEVK